MFNDKEVVLNEEQRRVLRALARQLVEWGKLQAELARALEEMQKMRHPRLGTAGVAGLMDQLPMVAFVKTSAEQVIYGNAAMVKETGRKGGGCVE